MNEALNATKTIADELQMKIEYPVIRSILHMNDSLHISLYTRIPNRWWRFWQFVFFGFRWEKVNPQP
jgi:hypothetical protein